MSRGFALAVLQVAGAACSWGLWSLFLRPAGLPPIVSALILLAGISVVSLVLGRFERVDAVWDLSTLAWLVIDGVCDGINIVTFFAAMQHTTVALAVLAHYLAPLIVAVSAPWAGGTRIAGARRAALAGLMGLAIVLAPWRAAEWSSETLLGVGLGVVSAFGYAGNVLATKRLVGRIGAARTQGWHAVIAALVLLPFAFMTDMTSVTPIGIGIVAAGAVLLGGVSSMMFARGVHIVGATTASMLTYLEPVVAVTVGVVVWNEAFAPSSLVGAVIIAGAGIYVVRASDRPDARLIDT